MNDINVHPVQSRENRHAQVPAVVTLRAYEVYCELFGRQEAMVTGSCRGGFAVGELIAFSYARSFPRPEWKERVDEALRGMKL